MTVEADTCETLDSLTVNKRCLFYEQLGYAFYEFWTKESLLKWSPEQEARTHLRRIKLLLLYFDVLLVHYNTMLNHPMVHRERMMLSLFTSDDLEMLLRSGLVMFTGEGKSQKEAFSFHREYVNEFGNTSQYGAFCGILKRGVTIIRSTRPHPDSTLYSSVISVMENHLRPQSDEYKILRQYVNKEQDALGGDVRYPPLYKNVASLNLSAEALSNLSKVLSVANMYAVLKSNTKAYIFHDFRLGPMSDVKITGTGTYNGVSSFLYSPEIFIAIMSLFEAKPGLDKLFRRPIDEYYKIREEGHKCFAESYHRILSELDAICSEEIVLNTEEMGPEVLKLVKERFEERLKTRSKEVNIREWTSIIGQLSVILANSVLSHWSVPGLAGVVFPRILDRIQKKVALRFRSIGEPELADFTNRINSLK